MIRERYVIDNELILFFLKSNNFNFSTQKSLLDWYALLDNKNFKLNRDKAIEFIKGVAEEVFGEVELSKLYKDKLIGVFEPLETILRTAQSLNIPKTVNLRDHLSHTVRVLLMSNYLFYEYYKINEEENKHKKEVFTAAIFHDLAYPIEKIKAVGKNLSDGTFELLNSSGEVEFTLNNPKDLLDLMNFWGSLPKEIETEFKVKKNPKLNYDEWEVINRKITHIYKEIIAPAIAGQGLFNTKHNLSSVVLFLRPIYKDWKNSKEYLQKKIETICDICLAIAYHDRSLPLSNFRKNEYSSEIPLAVKILRIADELQEWDRTQKMESFTENATFCKSSEIFNINFSLKNAEIITQDNSIEEKECNPCIFIPDKIEGLLPIINDNGLLIRYKLPYSKKIGDLKIKLNNNESEISIKDVLEEKFKVTGVINHVEKQIDEIKILFEKQGVNVYFIYSNKVLDCLKCEIRNDTIDNIISLSSSTNSEKNDFIIELKIFREILSKALDYDIPTTIGDEIKEDIANVFKTIPLNILKGRNQLGLLHCVKEDWKDVTHTRFEHSMGVAAKCIVVCDYLNSKTEESLKFSIKDVKELALAASLHDCGHLPVSHAVERAFLSSKFNKSDVTHEARIIPLLLRPNQYFEDLHLLIKDWIDNDKYFDNNSLYRVASIISHDKVKSFINDRIDLYPKRAISQLLSSDIDLDRLDYIIRDSKALRYGPVDLLSNEILKYIGNLSLKTSKTLNKGFESDVELCVEIKKEKDLQYIFYLLVSRVLLYKFCYFSKSVRSFEAILTYLISDFLERDISIEPLKLIAMSDNQFIGNDSESIMGYIENLLQFIPDITDRTHYKNKYVDVLKKDKTERFKKWYSIDMNNIKNPRLAKEFEENLEKHSYIDNLKRTIIEESKKENYKNPKKEIIEREDLLFDVFSLKTGGGDLLVSKNDNLKTLSKYMNGSNMHRLCTETRLDIYHKSDIGELKKSYIKSLIDNYYG